VLLVSFVLIELRAKAPLVRLSIFRVRSLTTANLVMFLVASAWDRAQGNRYLTLGLRPTARGDSSSWAAAFKKAAWSVRKAVG